MASVQDGIPTGNRWNFGLCACLAQGSYVEITCLYALVKRNSVAEDFVHAVQ
jgi:hypothetical protein